MRRIGRSFAVGLSAMLALAGCRLNVVWGNPSGEPAGGNLGVGVTAVEPIGQELLMVDCGYDGGAFGPGLMLLRHDGSSRSLLDCGVLSGPGVAPNGEIYVGYADPIDGISGAYIINPTTGARRVMFPLTFEGPFIRAIEFGPDGNPYLGTLVTGADRSAIFRAVFAGGRWNLTEMPGTRGLGNSEFAFDNDGSIVASTYNTHQVVRVTPAGDRSVLVGTGVAGFSGDGGPAVHAQLNQPRGVNFDHIGNLLIADNGNHRIRLVWHHSGEIATSVGDGRSACRADGIYAPSGSISGPMEVEQTSSVWIADSQCNALFEVSPTIRTRW